MTGAGGYSSPAPPTPFREVAPMRPTKALLTLLCPGVFLVLTASVPAPPPGEEKEDRWPRATEDDRAIKVETDKLEAVIPGKKPKQWMTGIEKGSFLDKATGSREIGDGLMVIDW